MSADGQAPECQLWAPRWGLLWSLLLALSCHFLACWLFGTVTVALGRQKGAPVGNTGPHALLSFLAVTCSSLG